MKGFLIQIRGCTSKSVLGFVLDSVLGNCALGGARQHSLAAQPIF
jgi:hypothetical protein